MKSIRNSITLWILALVICVFFTQTAAAQLIVYVDTNADPNGANDGSSWANAYNYLQDALADPNLFGPAEIWVAASTYKPDQGGGQTPGDREATFQLINDVAIYGGFPSGGGTPEQRDPNAYETILSGDIGIADVNTDNSYHVVTGSGTEPNAVLDGFTITAGNGSYGGGMYNNPGSPSVTNCTFSGNYAGNGGGMHNDNNSSPTLTNCTFSGNSADNHGGGMFNWHSDPTVTNCTFTGNLAEYAAGMYNNDGSPAVTNCTFSGNAAQVNGGGMRNVLNSSPTVTNCTFTGNLAGFDGGGMHNGGGSPTLTNCTFSGNSAEIRGGGMCNRDSNPAVTNCTLSGNTSDYKGGGMYNYSDGSPMVTNCILWGNYANSAGDEIYNDSGSEATFSYCDIEGGLNGDKCGGDDSIDGSGNINANPLFVDPNNANPNSRDYHLLSGSPCIDAGDPNGDYIGQTDIDGEPRVMGWFVDIGSDESGGVVEITYFVDDDAPGDPGPGDPDVSDPNEDGSREHPYDAIQEAINAATDGNTIGVFDGIYTGNGNRNINFDGRAIIVCSQNGPNSCIIDCEDSGRGFYFGSQEDANSILDGFNITNGYSWTVGGGIYCNGSSPTVKNCIFSGNSASTFGGGMYYFNNSSPTLTNCTITGNSVSGYGGGIYCSDSHPTLSNCMISSNNPDGVWIDTTDTGLLLGTVQIISNDLNGDGTFQIDPNSTLELSDSGISCNVVGFGTIHVPLGVELIIENGAVIDLGDPNDPNTKGTIQCDGLLRVKDNAQLRNANINVSRASSEGPSPYGRFFIEDSASINNNVFHSDGDRHIDMDPNDFNGTVEDNKIYITITEGLNDTPDGLLELRGDPNLAVPPCGPNEFFCQVNDVPPFDVNSWTVEQLEVVEGAKVKLTRRFDFGNGGLYEVLYVKNLILGPNCVLDTAFNRLYYENLEGDPNAVRNQALLGFSLGNIDCDDETEFDTRVTHNNAEDRIHVERIEGNEPDPDGMMLMRNLVDEDQNSPNDGKMINARSKGLFAKASDEEILVTFKYLFGTSDPDVELVVYLCDVPELLDHDDPCRADHYIEVARLRPPPVGRPGSAGSGRFGVFHRYAWCGDLNFVEGTWIELELIEPGGVGPLAGGAMGLKLMGSGGASAFADSMALGVYCSGEVVCADINWSLTVDEQDFLTVIGGYGYPAVGDVSCLDGTFSSDGYMDSYDIASWDWTLYSPDDRENLCGMPLIGAGMGMGMMGAAIGEKGFGWPSLLVDLPSLSDLLIAGKRGTSDDPTKLKDRLYVFDSNSLYRSSATPASEHCNIKVVRGPGGELYQINSETGVLRLDTDEVIIPPSPGGVELTDINEPRYDKPAMVYVGIQGSGEDSWGRPILDAAFDANYVYVVPVVVDPNGEEPYTAAAKLLLTPGETPPYDVVKLYDDPDTFNPSDTDNPNLNGTREVEVDDDGKLYVVNVHRRNESDILWIYDTNTAAVIECINWGDSNSDNYVPDPIGMYVSKTEYMLYLASGQRNLNDVNSAVIYGFSTNGALTLERSITINGMHHATSITGDPSTGFLWVAGFDMNDITGGPATNEEPFYHPYLAQIPPDSNEPDYVICLSGADDLAMPMSIVWTGIEEKCGGADLDESGDVSFDDFAILALQWHQAPGTPSADIYPKYGGDNMVNLLDLAVLIKHWLESGCTDPS